VLGRGAALTAAPVSSSDAAGQTCSCPGSDPRKTEGLIAGAFHLFAAGAQNS
jgi:hypothetical protein